MIEEMGITPDPTARTGRPTFKGTAKAVLFCVRAKRSAAAWAESKKMQEAVARKMEARKMKARVSGR